MVEKIIINPNKVRGYGNIMSPHSTSDYETYASSITSGTDTVNGQTMTVYEMEDTTLFLDIGTSTNHNDNWSSTTYMTRSDTGTTINNNGSSTLFESVRLNGTNIPFTNGDLVVEFELLTYNGSDNRIRFDAGTVCTGESYAQWDYIINSNSIGKWKFVYDSTAHTITRYKDGTLDAVVNKPLCGKLGFLFRVPNGNSIKYKNLRIYR